MAEPLPSGWMDTGQSITVTLTGSMSVRMSGVFGAYGTPTIPFVDSQEGITKVTLGGGPDKRWILGGVQRSTMDLITCGPEAPYLVAYETWLDGPFVGAPVRLEGDGTGGCTVSLDGSVAPFSGTYNYLETVGPFRLGARIVGISETPPVPQFWTDLRLEYAWFADEHTVRTRSCAGYAGETQYFQGNGTWATTPDVGMTPQLKDLVTLEFGGTSSNPDLLEGVLTNLSVAGWSVDTSDLAGSALQGAGSGAANVQGTTTGGAASAQAPYTITYDLDVLKFGTTTSAGVTLNSSRDGHHATPRTGTVTFRSVSWATDPTPGAETFDIVNTGSLYPANDAAVPLWASPGRLSPSAEFASYSPLSISLAQEVNVHRPDGAQTTDFVVNAPEKAAITEGTWTTITIYEPGAVLTRTFGASGTNLPAWRKWLGIGASGHGDAAFNPDLSHTTKHGAGEDIWDWSSYRYLRLTINNNLGGPEQNLTLTVRGVHLSISDPHTTGSDRYDNFSVTETPYEVSYPNLLFLGGSETSADVDLCFPTAGGPFYHSRIDQIALSGWAPGPCLLKGMKLVSKDPKTVWLKHALGAPVQRGDYSSLHASHNGANPTLNLGDQTNKTEEVGTYGGALRYVNILTGAVTGTILDSLLSLQAYALQLHGLEGWTVTWSQAAHDAANEDPYGVSLGVGTAEWMRQQHTYTGFNAGGSHSPACHPQVRCISPARGMETRLQTRHWTWGAVEAILSDGAEAVPDTAASLDSVSATSDAHGYVAWYPVQAAFTPPGHGELAPRDKVRILYTVPGQDTALYGVANLHFPLGYYLRAWAEDGAIKTRRADRWLPPFATAAANADAGPGSRYPDLYYEHRLCRATLLYQRDGSSYRRYTDDDGATWSSETMAFSGGKYPRAAVDPVTMAVAEFAYVGGVIRGHLREAGEATFGPEFTVSGIGALADAPFGVSWAYDEQRRIVFSVNNGSAIVEYVSTDDGRTVALA